MCQTKNGKYYQNPKELQALKQIRRTNDNEYDKRSGELGKGQKGIEEISQNNTKNDYTEEPLKHHLLRKRIKFTACDKNTENDNVNQNSFLLSSNVKTQVVKSKWVKPLQNIRKQVRILANEGNSKEMKRRLWLFNNVIS